MRRHDLTNKQFGRLVALFIDNESREPNKVKWVCACSCGRRKSVRADHLTRGKISSCGCLCAEMSAKINLSHGMTGTRTYKIWQGMKRRCENKNERFYPHYGGRGITICERWRSFTAFLADMGEAPDGMSIDRINNDLGYSPENCRWADDITQMNNMRSNRYIEFNGEKKSAANWSRETGVPSLTIISRINRGWPVETALFKKPRPTGRPDCQCKP